MKRSKKEEIEHEAYMWLRDIINKDDAMRVIDAIKEGKIKHLYIDYGTKENKGVDNG